MIDFEMMMVDGRSTYFSFGGEIRGLENIDSFLWRKYNYIGDFTHRLIGGIDDFLPVLEECDFHDVVVWRGEEEEYWFIKHGDSGNIIVITEIMVESDLTLTHVLTKSLGWGWVSGSDKEWLLFKSLPEAMIALNRYFSEEA